MKLYLKTICLLLGLLAGAAEAAICTTLSAGNWNTQSRWSCGRVPLPADTVVIAHNIQLNNNYTVAGLTINVGTTLNDNGNTLTVTGNVINNGTFGGGGGRVTMTAAGSTISGSGVFSNSRLYVDAANVSLVAGASMNYTQGAQIRVGRNTPGSFTIAGTITDTGNPVNTRILRVYGSSTVTISGTLNTPNSFARIQAGGTVVNNGTVVLRYLDGQNAATANWTQGANSSLTMTQPLVSWAGVFNATATGNTVSLSGVQAYTLGGANPSAFYNLNLSGNTANPNITLAGNVTAAGVLSGTARLTSTCPVDYTLTHSGGVLHSCFRVIAEYRFDDASGGLAADMSGNGLHGALNGGVASGGGKVCGGYNFNGTDGFVSVPNNVLLNPTRVTVAAWVRHNSTTFKTWESIITKGDTAYRMHLNGGCSLNTYTPNALDFGINTGCNTADVDSTTVPTLNQWYHVAGTYDGATLRIYINGAQQASVAYAGGNIPSNTFPLNIGANAQQAGRFWSGDIDEVKILSTVLTAAQIQTMYTNENAGKNWDGSARVCSSLDHYEISVPPASVTCQATDVTVTACANNTNPCTSVATGINGNATLSTTGGTIGVAGLVNGVGVARLSYPAALDGTTVTVSLASAPAAAVGATSCRGGAAGCVTTFNTAGFIFSGTTNSAVATVPVADQIAGTTSGTYYLRAVKANTTTQACEAALVGAQSVNLGYECLNPATCSGSDLMSVNGGTSTVIARNNKGSATSSTAVNMTFDANGNAPFTLNYGDVGQVVLHASKAAAGNLLTSLAGASNSFVVKPGGFVLSNIVRSRDAFANPAAANAAGAVFINAGEAFSVTVTATTSGGVATPNYGKEDMPESVKLTPANVVAGMVTPPAIGGSFGTFGLDCAGATGIKGVACGNAFTWDEVGIITLTPSVADGDYLGAGDVAGTTSGNVGRFIPDHFDTEVVLDASGKLPMTCLAGWTCPTAYPGFVYSGQQFSLKVSAMKAGGAAAANYNTTTGFAKTVSLSAVGAPGTNNPVTSAGGLGVGSVNAFAAGTLTVSNETYSFNTTPDKPANVYVRAIDTDSATSLRASGTVEGGVAVASGRIKVSNAYGSELLPLTLTAQAQYYSANGWVASLTDNVTKLAPTYGGTLTANATITPATKVLNGGSLSIKLAAPNAAGTVTVTPSIDAASPGNPPLTLISGTATFGIYKTNNTFIYRRER